MLKLRDENPVGQPGFLMPEGNQMTHTTFDQQNYETGFQLHVERTVKKVLNQLDEVHFSEINSTWSDYFGKNVIHVIINHALHLHLAMSHGRLAVTVLGVKWKRYDIQPELLEDQLPSIVAKHIGNPHGL